MAYNEHLADRIRQFFQEKKVGFEEKKMMGGLCFMVDDKMCVGVHTDKLMGMGQDESLIEKEMKFILKYLPL